MQTRVGKPNALVTVERNGLLRPTKFYRDLEAHLDRIWPVLLVLDNSVKMYPGSEIDRAMVTAFCNSLSGLAVRYDMAVVLLGHPAKVEGSEYSGNTAWNNAVRSRWFFSRNDDATLTLEKAKANYSKLESITLEYRPGVIETHIYAAIWTKGGNVPSPR